MSQMGATTQTACPARWNPRIHGRIERRPNDKLPTELIYGDDLGYPTFNSLLWSCLHHRYAVTDKDTFLLPK